MMLVKDMVIEVGKSYPMIKKNEVDGSVFELQSDCFVMSIYINGLRREDVRFFLESEVSVRVFKEGNFLITLFRFGDDEMTFEAIFDPNLYKNGEHLNLLHSKRIVCIGVQNETNIVFGIRSVLASNKLFKVWQETWLQSLIEENYSSRYKEWTAGVYERYSLVETWYEATDYGVLKG